ncbi:putative Protein kinase [Leptomonas seymouri]|uniref:dual-specificity kinase n=1 Tax=Leptomonas seymouri TaxID=5684 RepID=A0A0N0P836_LEPSE|nr:putative Protein kinase [Leptomonas seymouri]|eukprot:KPI89509.1 putative Protein kinase [Leptomonas seymouri]
MSVSEGLRKYGNYLTPYEKKEITNYTNIYYCGQDCRDKINAPTTGPNNGFDTNVGEYIFRANDHIAYRYEILEELGSGAFGQVLKAIDHAEEQTVAVKLIRNKRKVSQQAAHEIDILDYVNSRDPKNLYGVVRMIDSFSFRGHTCISYELLGTSLYEYQKEKNFYPMALSLIRGIAARMLITLTFLGRENIVHCDLKPENILLRGSDPSVVKLVDLGSASFDAENASMYIQSRFYRAPEVILEQKYTKAIDWWSFGCILCELANGDPIFPGEDEKDQLGCIMEYLGPPPQSFIEASSARRKREFFDEHFRPRERQTPKGRVRVPSSKSLAKFLGVPEDDDFLSFVMQFLQWDPASRVSPREAMQHQWISGEFVFPTKAEEKGTATSTPDVGTSSSVAASGSKESDGAAKPVEAAHGMAARTAESGATAGVAASSCLPLNTQATLEPAARKMRSDPLPGGDYHNSGVASAPQLTSSDGSCAPRATVQSTGGAPQKPTTARRNSGPVSRSRQRRSTAMTDVEMLVVGAPSRPTTIAEGAAGEKVRDVLTSSEGDGATTFTPGSAVPRYAFSSGGSRHAPPALKPGEPSPTAPPTPAYPAVATMHQPMQRVVVKRGAGNTTSASTLDGKEHLKGGVRSSRNGVLQLGKEARFSPGNEDSIHTRTKDPEKQPSMQELVPMAWQVATKGKGSATRRKEYSLTIDGTPTQSPLECVPPATERPHEHSKNCVISSGLGLETTNRGCTLPSASRPHVPVSSFIFARAEMNHPSTDEKLCNSGETVMLSVPPSRASAPDSAVSVTTTVPRQAGESTVPWRSKRCNLSCSRNGGMRDLEDRQDHVVTSGASAEEAKGCHPAPDEVLRLVSQRQPSSRQPRRNMSVALNEVKKPSTPTTVLPPLKKSFAG